MIGPTTSNVSLSSATGYPPGQAPKKVEGGTLTKSGGDDQCSISLFEGSELVGQLVKARVVKGSLNEGSITFTGTDRSLGADANEVSWVLKPTKST